MFNLHGGTIISTAWVSLLNIAALLALEGRGSALLLLFLFLVVTVGSLVVSVATLIRFFTNMRHHKFSLKVPKVTKVK